MNATEKGFPGHRLRITNNKDANRQPVNQVARTRLYLLEVSHGTVDVVLVVQAETSVQSNQSSDISRSVSVVHKNTDDFFFFVLKNYCVISSPCLAMFMESWPRLL